jgi:histidyl-tRNA synthetase
LTTLLADQTLWQKSDSLTELFPALEALGVREYTDFAPNVIRGLDYYTGTVFEAQTLGGDLRRAILGGGRYDNLLSEVGGKKIPATGFAMGDLVITLVLEELDLIPEEIKSPPAAILVTVFDDQTLKDSLVLSGELRDAGFNVNCYPEVEKLGKQLKFGDRSNAKIAVLLGPDEIQKDEVALKNLSTGEQKSVHRSQMVEMINKMLENTPPS